MAQEYIKVLMTPECVYKNGSNLTPSRNFLLQQKREIKT